MKQFLEGSQAVAHCIKAVKPGVISAYPITPQTHIVEELAQMVANGELDSQFINVESEHSAASVVLGGSATGVRVFTATSSQGLLLMAEVIFNIAGMRLPVVLTCANRAISAPINIWNDQQDSISLRDAGWIQFYAESNQDVVDLHLMAYRIAEDNDVMLPVMVCMDGFALTHAVEVVDIPAAEQVKKFLPDYKAPYKLDIDNPITLGFLADPGCYMECRYAVQKTLRETLDLIPKVQAEFNAVFGRSAGGLVEEYMVKDAENVIVAMGSVCGTIKDVVDELRSKGKKVGLLKVITYRPFPEQAIYEALKNTGRVAVLDKSISLGAYGPLYTDLKGAFFARKKAPKAISGFVAGLGGRDITRETIKDIFKKLSGKQVNAEFMDLKPELLEEKA
ncbi:MAG: transketolase C-terminal domain-containing protein [Candidatus Omnitrophica bacterium]|nr:transketolase C-terminal domain-containing protein [Candidatus Omnitrophota bacterium]